MDGDESQPTVAVRVRDAARAAGVVRWLERGGLAVIEDPTDADVVVREETPVAASGAPTVVTILETVGPGPIQAWLTIAECRGLVSWRSPPCVFAAAVRAAANGWRYLCPVEVTPVVVGELQVGRKRGAGLTGRQAQVAELAASGLTNREIAGHLGVAIGTVKTHLRDAIRKVGCYDRYGLAEAYGYPRPES